MISNAEATATALAPTAELTKANPIPMSGGISAIGGTYRRRVLHDATRRSPRSRGVRVRIAVPWPSRRSPKHQYEPRDQQVAKAPVGAGHRQIAKKRLSAGVWGRVAVATHLLRQRRGDEAPHPNLSRRVLSSAP